MPAQFHAVTACRICGSSKLETVLSLGQQALTGVFRRPEDPEPITTPIELTFCHDCKFLQSGHTVDADLMYAEYWYRSGTNQTMIDHLTGVVSDAVMRVSLVPGDVCIDIGCNDGTLLRAYEGRGVNRIGVDPSDAIKSISDPSITKINNYFTAANVAGALDGRKAKVITSISMFYDLDRPNDFVRDITQVLDPNGIWVVEMNYTANMIASCGYDMISHEHVAYYTLRTFERLITKHGLKVLDATFNTINGGSIRLFAGFAGTPSDSVAEVSARELAAGLEEPKTYHAYADVIERFKVKLRDLLTGIHARGEKIAVYGASTRGNTILQHCGITGDLIFAAADRNPMKWGLQTSGSKVAIRSEEEVRAVNPEYMLVLPYYFLPEFLQREHAYLENGGKFIVPLPQLRIISMKDGALLEQSV
jgi:2-polyprenyl-3-methyl-5-hydroxy-6-metoxy-1,4-benzoquinol methylase